MTDDEITDVSAWLIAQRPRDPRPAISEHEPTSELPGEQQPQATEAEPRRISLEHVSAGEIHGRKTSAAKLRRNRSSACETERVSRRTFLMNVGIALNAAGGAGDRHARGGLRARPGAAPQGVSRVDRHWRRDRFRCPARPGWSRIAIRLRIRGMARPPISPPTCAAPSPGSTRCSPSTARISAARCAGSLSRNSSCARATEACTTPMAVARRGRRSADSSPTR